MRIISAKKGDILEVSNCRIKSIKKINSNCYSEKTLSILTEDNSPKNIQEEIQKQQNYCVKKRKKIVGNVSFYKNKIDGLFIDPDFAGKGYGKKLLKFTEKKIKKNHKTAHLYSTLNSEKFYLKQGYIAKDIVIAGEDEPFQLVEMIKKL